MIKNHAIIAAIFLWGMTVLASTAPGVIFSPWELRTYSAVQASAKPDWQPFSSSSGQIDKGFFGYIEYRTRFSIPKELFRGPVGVYIGTAGEIDRVFANGV